MWPLQLRPEPLQQGVIASIAPSKVGGRLIRKSLEMAVFAVAKQRFPDNLREYRSGHESTKAFPDGKMTVDDGCMFTFARHWLASRSLKPRSKDYRAMMIDFIERSWPALLQIDVWKVSARDYEERARALSTTICPDGCQ